MEAAVRDELISLRGLIDGAEQRWLVLLGEFDELGLWAAEGFRSAVSWVAHHCGLSRIGASERVRVARALRRRPVLAAAFAEGRLSYSKVRAASRLDPRGVDEVDEALVEFAAGHSTDEVERLVKRWRSEVGEQRDPALALARFDSVGLRASTTFDGLGVIELVTTADEHHELLALVDAYVERRYLDTIGARGVSAETPETPETPIKPFWQRRAEALVALVRRGHAGLDVPVDSSGADRYTLNVSATLPDLLGHRCSEATLASSGEPVSVQTALRFACDCSVVRHLLKGASEPIDIGRKTPVWTVAQRRAVRRRDGHRCRFPGCGNRFTDVHHIRHWTRGGVTAVWNGCLLCPLHHGLVHEGGWTLTGHGHETLVFTSPHGHTLASDPPQPIPAAPPTPTRTTEGHPALDAAQAAALV